MSTGNEHEWVRLRTSSVEFGILTTSGGSASRNRCCFAGNYGWPSVYSKLVALEQRFGIADRIEARNGRPPHERVVQDIEVPI